MKVYSAPASTAGVERNHKVAKRIHSASRNRTSRGKVEEQVAVAHNSVVLDLEIDSYRQNTGTWGRVFRVLGDGADNLAITESLHSRLYLGLQNWTTSNSVGQTVRLEERGHYGGQDGSGRDELAVTVADDPSVELTLAEVDEPEDEPPEQTLLSGVIRSAYKAKVPTVHSVGAAASASDNRDKQALLVHILASSASVGVTSVVPLKPESVMHAAAFVEVMIVWSATTSHVAALVAATSAAAEARAANFMAWKWMSSLTCRQLRKFGNEVLHRLPEARG
ncbi:hypothetical protein PC120_g16343 [Phytophthora cactorum]|nr:hypothetical protein PC120_g16343 [Phytophthora cactorum]